MEKLEIVAAAYGFVVEMNKLGLALNYTLESLERLEQYLELSLEAPGQPKSGSFFSDDDEAGIFAMGAYVGEVMRRSSKVLKWSIPDPDDPYAIVLESPDSTTFVISKAFKRFYEGREDNLHVFAASMLKNYINPDVDIPADFFDETDLRIQQFGGSPICNYFSSVKETNKVEHIYSTDGIWFFFTRMEELTERGRWPYEMMFLDEVKARHPELAPQLTGNQNRHLVRQPDGTYKHQKPVNTAKSKPEPKASNPGGVRVDFFQWMKFNRSKSLRLLFLLAASIALTVLVHWLFAFFVLVILVRMGWYWMMLKQTYKIGDVNPGKVISLNPVLVAVSTDLKKMHGSNFPVLRIFETQLPKEDQVLNTIIPTIALYYDNPHNYPFWAEFDPQPMVHGISNQETLHNFKSRFSKDDLSYLDYCLKQVNKTEVGVFKIDADKNNWAGYNHVDIAKGINMEGPKKK